MPGSFDDEDRKANNDSDWESDDDDNDESEEMTESEEEEDDDDDDRFDDDEDEGNDDDEDEDEQRRDEDDDEEDEEDDGNKSNEDYEDDEEDDEYPDEEKGLQYQHDDEDDVFGTVPLEQSPFQDEHIGEEANKESNGEALKNSLLTCFLCCICLILVTSAVVLGVVFSKGSNTVESATLAPVIPTAPSPAPASTPELLTSKPAQLLPSLAPLPTASPTMSPAPTNATTEFPSFFPTLAPSMIPTISMEPTDPVRPEMTILPEEDTFINRGGFRPGDSNGKAQTLLVQNGPEGVNEIPDAYALLLFSLEDVPQPWRITDREPQALLRLTQIIRNDIEPLAPSNLTVVRLPATPLAVETLTGMIFEPYDGIAGPSFIVNATQRRIEVDITSLIFGQPPYVASRRQLQGKGSQLFIMIENQGAEQVNGGNLFASRESLDSPELYIGLFKPGAPRPTQSPTPSPTTSPQPSVSGAPSFVNMTTQPSSSVIDTKAPTITNETGPASASPTKADIQI